MTLNMQERRLWLQRRLDKARANARDLSAAVEFYGALMAALIDEPPAIELPDLDPSALEAKLSAGQPILYGEALGFDADAIRALLVKLCAVTEQFVLRPAQDATKPPSGTAPKRFPWSRKPDDQSAARALAAAQIRQALENGTLDFDALLEQLVLGHDADLVALATRAQLDANLLITLARFAMRPTLMAYADAFADAVCEYSDQWMRGLCPVCGGAPALGEYRDVDQSRHLRCAACGASWLFRRLECPHCGTTEFRALSYIKLTDDPTHQADTCDHCKRYVKSVAASEPLSRDWLPLEDLLTLPLDAAAQAGGYTR